MDEDLVLIDRFKAGDATAFDDLMQRHYKSVLNLVYRFTGATGQPAEDLAQDVFLRVYRALPRFEARARFFTYLYKVTMNLCLKERARWARRRSRTVSLDSNWDDPEVPNFRVLPDPAGSALERYERAEVAVEVREAVMELPEDQRAAVVLHRFNHLSYEEITEVLGISLPAVKSRLHRAKLALQKKLAGVVDQDLLGDDRQEASGS